MAPKLPKRTLDAKDLGNPDKVLDVLNPVSEALSNALDKGLTLGNLRHVLVSAEVTPPDEWTPLDLLNGTTAYTAGYGTPAVQWTPTGAEMRGLLNVTTGADLGTPFARVPIAASGLRPSVTNVLPCITDSYVPGALEIRPDGTVYLGAPTAISTPGWVSLGGVRYQCLSGPPLWAKPVDVTLQPETQQDWGRPSVVLVVGASRDDRVPCLPDALPSWEAPILTEGRSKRRVLRIQRVGGLVPGVRHRVTLLALYE